MKWIALLVLLVAAPAIAMWLRNQPRQAPFVWGLLTFLPFVQEPWNLAVAPYATPLWLGYVKGWEISLLDAVAFGVIFGTRGPFPKPAFMLPFLAYILAATLAVFQARFPSYAIAYPEQLLRVFLVFLAVSKIAAMERGERALLIGLFAGIGIQACYAIWARANGALQTGGTLGHQNMLGFVSHMALMPAFAVLLSGKMPRWSLVATGLAMIAVILTASRATIVLAGVGLIMTLFLSLAVTFTSRKAAVGALGLLLIVVSAPLAYASLERRFVAQNMGITEQEGQRAAFMRAATAMIDMYPMGVGPNHYVFVSITEGFADRANVDWNSGNRLAHVHNSYILVRAETGLLGLLTFVMLIGFAIVSAFLGAFRFKRQVGSDVLIGLGVGLAIASLHAFWEWMFVVSTTQYVLAGSLGLIAGLWSRYSAQAKGRNQKPRRRQQAGGLTVGSPTEALQVSRFR